MSLVFKLSSDDDFAPSGNTQGQEVQKLINVGVGQYLPACHVFINSHLELVELSCLQTYRQIPTQAANSMLSECRGW